ncbi:phage tail protein domain protein [Variovorax sp. PBS-H4]|uniref:phage tail protein n=1 Tax=Variovorax sp. PBS-H4 TaxID=434008 RepID=UPI0013198CF5|nr:phage tail protein [Variovorax sp. PBS-H4]VTU20034.1 phage tail protein domain protein [Variovorax sp. PBS-H4]
MSCLPMAATFRLLDPLVGWDADSVEGIGGLDLDSGLQLAFIGGAGGIVPADDVSAWLAPAALARGCAPCEWLLVTPCPPQSRLLRKDVCSPCFAEADPGAVGILGCAVAVATAGRHVAVADTGEDAVFLFADHGRRLVTRVAFVHPGPITSAPWQEWLVIDSANKRVACLDLAGFARGHLPLALPGPVDRMAVDSEERIWLAVEEAPADGRAQVSLWVAARFDAAFTRATLDELQRAFEPNGITVTSPRGFCLAGQEAACGPCFSWFGRELDPPLTPVAPSAQYVAQGQLLTLAIDSGIPRCRWHRVRWEGSRPAGTAVSISVSASDAPLPAAQGVADGIWAAFAPGRPHPGDWQRVDDQRDFLIRQAQGRYLFVRIRMTGDGRQTPRIRRMRIDFPRQTSLDQLPLVFRDSPEAEDFTERFLALFDSFLDDVDEQIARMPALLDVDGVPDGVLPWLGSFLDIAMDPAWDAARRRRLLQAAPKLYRMRGTLDGMRAVIRLVFDVDPVIREAGNERAWGALGAVALGGGTRLFGPSQWRFRLDRSRLGRAPLRSVGQVELDPFSSVAYRFDVLVPLRLDATLRQRMQQLIEAQKPAHTVTRLIGSRGQFLLGGEVSVGIDTTLAPFEPSVLGGGGNVRLGRATVLSASRAADADAPRLGA